MEIQFSVVSEYQALHVERVRLVPVHSLVYLIQKIQPPTSSTLLRDMPLKVPNVEASLQWNHWQFGQAIGHKEAESR